MRLFLALSALSASIYFLVSDKASETRLSSPLSDFSSWPLNSKFSDLNSIFSLLRISYSLYILFQYSYSDFITSSYPGGNFWNPSLILVSLSLIFDMPFVYNF